jgi:hypothetical protein
MVRYGWLLVPVLALAWGPPASAGILFFRKAKPNPAERVPELLKIVKEESDEKKRAAAVEELQQFDTKSFPQIVTTLIEVLQRDAGWTVRLAAAETLGKIRPVDQQIGFALEQALAHDKTMRVRMAARTSLWQYYIHGYRPAKTPEGGDQSGEPPLARPAGAPQGAPPPGRESAEPPLAVPQTSTKPVNSRTKTASKVASATPAPVSARPAVAKPRVTVPTPVPVFLADDGGPSLNLPQ